MKLAIMQPYVFPYIGYFQLIAIVDQFVIHDDVQWIKGGWINRNRILVNGQSHYITFPIQKGASTLNINEREFSADIDSCKKKILLQIEGAYRKAPYFTSVFSLISRCLACEEKIVSRFATNSLRECCNYLDITTPFVMSSELDKSNELTAEARVLDINKVMGASHYINPIGGMELYNQTRFSEKGLILNFIKSRDIVYKQFQGDNCVPFLSIIDVMMFNSKVDILGMLREYDLL